MAFLPMSVGNHDMASSSPFTACREGEWLLRRDEACRFERAFDLAVLLHLCERCRHVLRAAVPRLDLNKRIRAGERVGRFGLGALRGEQVEATAAIDGFTGLAHR